MRLAERQRLSVYASPATGGGRIGFPENHPLFQGILPPAVGPLGEALAAHDFVLCAGTSVFPYYPNVPGPLLADTTSLLAITSDPDEAARAPMGDALVADVALTLASLADAVGDSDRQAPAVRPAPDAVPVTDPMSPSTAVRALAQVFPPDGIVVLESPSATLALRNQLRISAPGSYYFSAGGGLGFAMPAAIGVALAQPERPVVCVIGEGSAQYAVQSLWSAAAYDVPVTFLVLRNDEYAILKWFAHARGDQRRSRPGPAGTGLRGAGKWLRRRRPAGNRPRRTGTGAVSRDRLRASRADRSACRPRNGARVRRRSDA